MVPAAFVALETLPKTANGKVDRRALPLPPEGAEAARAAPMPLANERQRGLGAIWEEVLGIRPIGAADDILALGADSIQLFQIVARARRAGIHVGAQDLLRRRTIGALDAHLSDASVLPPPTARRLPRLSDFRRKANQP